MAVLRGVNTIDFETRSRVDIKKAGASKYARHASTKILCIGYKLTGCDLKLWKPGDPKPDDLLDAVTWGAECFYGHNVGFERQIWYHICHLQYGWPDVDVDLWRCTAARCNSLALPRALANAAQVMGLSATKDLEGRRVMLQMAKPRKPTKNNSREWVEDPAKYKKLYSYCLDDVAAEDELHETIGELPPAELKLWQLDQRINLRGIPIDREGVRRAQQIVDVQYNRCLDDLKRITDGKITTPGQTARIVDWLDERGVETTSINAENVDRMLADDIPAECRELLEVRKRSGMSSVKKLVSMETTVDDDDRIRGTMMYHGALTGRWAGKMVQPHNFPRGFGEKDIGYFHRILSQDSTGDRLAQIYGDPVKAISNALRSFIKAPYGSRFLVCDFAAIEARVLAWLAGQADMLDIFYDNVAGRGPYEVMASRIYGADIEDVTKEQRSIGKVAVLGLGYGMGARAFVNTCARLAGVTISMRFSRKVVKTYRNTNSTIKSLWREVSEAAELAIQEKATVDIRGGMSISADDDWMRIRLPSGRDLHYRKPFLKRTVAKWSIGFEGRIWGPESAGEELEEADIKLGARRDDHWEGCEGPPTMVHGIKALGLKAKLNSRKPKHVNVVKFWGNGENRHWTVISTYGAKLVENITQAVARDFLAEAMFRCDDDYPVIATIHDEIVSELPNGQGTLAEFENVMRKVPEWGRGCPIDVEGFESTRYRK